MRKVFPGLLAILIAAAMLLPNATAMAKSEKEVKAQLKDGLTIKSPKMADVGQTITITVFSKHKQQPVAAAEVYARKTRKINTPPVSDNITSTTVHTAIGPTTVAKADDNGIDKEIKHVTGFTTGIHLGRTNEKGELSCNFAETDYYMLAAFKDGYTSGVTRIIIIPASQEPLLVKAPHMADVSEPVPITVYDRSDRKPVAKAAVYAKRLGDMINTPRTISPGHKVTNGTATSIAIAHPEAINTSEVKAGGYFIAYTNENGEVIHKFAEPGRYVLVAFKETHAPGFARINIGLAQQGTLVINATSETYVGKAVRLATIERNTGKPVAQTSIYALRFEDVDESTKASLKASSETAAIAKGKGAFIGLTNDNGELYHRFGRQGKYMLVALKSGYTSDLAEIQVKLPLLEKPEKLKAVTVPRPVTSAPVAH